MRGCARGGASDVVLGKQAAKINLLDEHRQKESLVRCLCSNDRVDIDANTNKDYISENVSGNYSRYMISYLFYDSH